QLWRTQPCSSRWPRKASTDGGRRALPGACPAQRYRRDLPNRPQAEARPINALLAHDPAGLRASDTAYFAWHAPPAGAAASRLRPKTHCTGLCTITRRRSLRHRRYSVVVICVSSASTALVWNWAHRVHPDFTSTKKTPLAPWLNYDGPRRWGGKRGKSVSRRKCGCHAREMHSCCKEAYARGKA